MISYRIHQINKCDYPRLAEGSANLGLYNRKLILNMEKFTIRLHITFVILFLFLCFSKIAFAIEGSPPPKTVFLSLREAILLSLRFNPIVQVEEIQRIIDKYNLRVSYWNYEPKYGITANATYNKRVSSGISTETDNQNFIPTASLLTPLGTQLNLNMQNPVTHVSGSPRFYNPAINLNLVQPLLKGFGPDVALAPLHTAQNQELINQLTMKGTMMQTITTVIGQYAALAQAQNSLAAQRLSLKNTIETYKREVARVKAGRAAEADLIQFKASIASQQLSVEQQEVNIEQSQSALLAVLGIDPTTPLKTVDQVKFDNDSIPTLENCIKMGLANNIQYQIELINLRLAKIALTVAEDNQRWQLDFVASRTQGAGVGGPPNEGFPSLFNGQNKNSTVGVNLTIPIDNLQQQRDLAQAQVNLRQEYVRLAAQKRQVIINVENSYYVVLNQKQQIVQAKLALDFAVQTLDIAEAKLKYGRTTPFEVSTLQTNVINQQLSYINAIAAYVVNLAILDQIIGNTLDRWTVCLKY